MTIVLQKQKLQILATVLRRNGVMLMNGPPVTRTFRRAALQAGQGRVMCEVEDEQENFLLHTQLFSPLGLTRSNGAAYAGDLDARYNRTGEACATAASATHGHCLGRSVADKLDYGCLPFLYNFIFPNGTAEPITQRMFPIEIVRIGAGYVQGVGKLVTKRSGATTVGARRVEISLYRWGSLVSRTADVAAPEYQVHLALGEGEVAIVEDATGLSGSSGRVKAPA